MHRTQIGIPKPDVTAPKCGTCGKRVGKICTDDDGRSYRDCDCTKRARLIAAAPEMLDALRLADRILQRDGIQQIRGEAFTDGEVDQICAAIAKAEGRTDG